MFGTFFKASLKALPVLVLLPIIAFTVFLFLIDGHFAATGAMLSMESAWLNVNFGGGGAGLAWMRTVMLITMLVNFVLLMIIPSAIGGLDPGAKQKQFYLGFFLNLAIMLLIPIVAHTRFVFNGSLLGALIGLCALSSLVPFVVGSRLVAPAYIRPFWFSH